MVRRGTNEAIGGQVDEREGQGQERNLDNACRGRLSLSDRQHAHRDKRAITPRRGVIVAPGIDEEAAAIHACLAQRAEQRPAAAALGRALRDAARRLGVH